MHRGGPKQSSRVHAASSGPAPPARSYAVDISSAGRRAWLVKVPAILARIAEPHNASGDEIATFASMPSGPSLGAKKGSDRSRESFKLVVNSDRCVEVLGAEKAAAVPTLFKMTVAPPSVGARILVASGDTYRFEAQVAASGTVVPDMSDPKFSSYQSQKREDEKLATSKRSRAMIVADDGILEAMDRTRAANEAAAVAAALAAANAKAAAAAAAAGKIEVAARGTTVLQLFERAAHWKAVDIARTLGIREADVKTQLKPVADYVRAGKFAKHWICKVEFRTPAMPLADDDAMTNRLTGGA